MARQAVVQPLSGAAGAAPSQAPAAGEADKVPEVPDSSNTEREKFTLKPSVATWLQVPATEKQPQPDATEALLAVDPKQQAIRHSSCWAGVMKIFQKKATTSQ